MKKRYISCLIPPFLGLLIWPAANAIAEDKYQPIQQAANPGIFIFCLLLFVLALLAIWLLKSSVKLKLMDQAEPNRSEWINKHLYDLEAHQLEKLINRRQHAAKGKVNNSKNNKK